MTRPLATLSSAVVQIRLVWRLWQDRLVPLWVKAVPALTAAYVLWPIDLLSESPRPGPTG